MFWEKKFDIMGILETDLNKYSDLGDIIIWGDTNTITGVDMEGLDNSDSDKYIPNPPDISNGKSLKRNSMDTVCCQKR